MQKRVFDVVVSVSLLIILTPLFVFLALLLFATNGHPIFYRQLRAGKDKIPFRIVKFRTMYRGAEKDQFRYRRLNEAPEPMFKLGNDPRFNRWGKFLSKTGLDELPQLWNIIKGEMSLVGPRPLPIKEAQALDNSWNFRFRVRPGIFSEWSANTQRHTSKKAWLDLDKKTIQSASCFQDIKLILKTIHLQLYTLTPRFWK